MHVEVLSLSRLEEHDVVAILKKRILIEEPQFGLGIEFGVFSAVWQQGGQVVEQMPMPEVSSAISSDLPREPER